MSSRADARPRAELALAGGAQAALLAEAARDEHHTWWVALRRDLHRHPELAWREFRTGAIVAQTLQELGYEVRVGGEAVEAAGRVGLPSAAELEQARHRALELGAPAPLVEAMGEGLTGVTGTLRTGAGPVVALRFDMDAIELNEATGERHRPAREGFGSVNPGTMHACGHDGHTAIGLGVARVLAAIRGALSAGTVRLIFQPGEEGARGARAMLGKEVVADADYFLAAHIGGRGLRVGEVVAAATEFHASTKLDAYFVGRAAHAGANPEEGRNALLAASTAALTLHALPRHGAGVTFVNVGTLRAGGGRNVVPAQAYLQLETRGQDDALNAFMEAAARRALETAAAMYGVEVSVVECGRTLGASVDPELATLVADVAAGLPGITRVHATQPLEGGEDATFLMRAVQRRGGRAGYMVLGASHVMGHHTDHFDFDEEVLRCGVRLFGAVTVRLLAGALAAGVGAAPSPLEAGVGNA